MPLLKMPNVKFTAYENVLKNLHIKTFKVKFEV